MLDIFRSRKKKKVFAKAMVASFPSMLPPPKPLVSYFEWLDKNGLYRNFDNDGYAYALIGPSQETTSLNIHPCNPEHSRTWSGSDDPEVCNRFAAFCQTGGDGSCAGLWLDDAGIIQFVHCGSGSGSTMIGVLTNDPVDFLRLLAIGYDELCWPSQHAKTPADVAAEYLEEDDEARYPLPPVALQNWVASTFNVRIPDRASEVIRTVSDMDAESSEDPFWLWSRKAQRWQ